MTDRRGAIAAELERGMAESVLFFKSLSPDELRVQVYQDGAQWTVQQVLAHFIAIERSMQWLLSVYAEMVDFGSGQGRSDFATAGVVRLRRELQRTRTPARAERYRLWMDTYKDILAGGRALRSPPARGRGLKRATAETVTICHASPLCGNEPPSHQRTDKNNLLKLAADLKYIPGIYNYCDRWCERCPFTSRCLNCAQKCPLDG